MTRSSRLHSLDLRGSLLSLPPQVPRPRAFALALVIATVAPILTTGPSAGAPSPHPVAAAERQFALRPEGSIRLTPEIDVPTGVAVVGVRWSGSAPSGVIAEARVRADGIWGAWAPLHTDLEHGPDAGTREAATAHQATDPQVVVGERAQVRLRAVAAATALSTAVKDATVVAVEPGSSEADSLVGTLAPGAAHADAARPTVLTRRDWGADESLRTAAPVYEQAHAAFIHHTAGTNAYTPEQVPAILRGIYAYHVRTQGWTDIGYNALVDRFGRIWEGRYGGLDKAVSGAHTLNRNGESFGVAAIGDFSATTPPSAMVTSISRFVAWKMSVHGNPATGRVMVNGDTFERISGHRDAFATTCPGARLYALLPSLRASVATRMGTMSPVRINRSLVGGGEADVLLAEPDEQGALRISAVAGASPQPVREARRIGTGWQVLDLISLTPDLTGDGAADIVARHPSTGTLRIYAGDGVGGFAGVRVTAATWAGITQIVASGDRTGDGRADLLSVTSAGVLQLHAGTPDGSLAAPVALTSGLAEVRSLTSVGDLDGDGVAEVVGVRVSDSALVRLSSVPGGGVQPPAAVSPGWSSLTSVIGAGDLDRDGATGDLLAAEATGRMRTYYAGPAAMLARYSFWGGGWSGMSPISSGADWDGDGLTDVLARKSSTGDLFLYAGTGARDLNGPPVTLPTTLPNVNLLRLVGDIDADGYADAIARSTNGDLPYLRGSSQGLSAPVVFGRGWQIFDLIEPAGDLTRDGVPDILARTPSGELRVYAPRADFTWSWISLLGTGWGSMRSVTGVGSANADFNADVVALREDGSVALFRGSGPGSLRTSETVLGPQADLDRLLGLGDVNGDGLADLVAQLRGGGMVVYLGTGRGFRQPRQPFAFSGTTGALVG